MKMCEQILKKHSRTSPDAQLQQFSLTKQKTRPRTDNENIGKTISKTENQCQNATCERKNH